MKKFIVLALIIVMISSFASADVQDDFDRADSSTLGTATNGNVWTETVAAGDWEILSNSMHGTGAGAHLWAQLELSSSNPTDIGFNISWDETCAGTKNWYSSTNAVSGTANGGLYIIWCRSGQAHGKISIVVLCFKQG